MFPYVHKMIPPIYYEAFFKGCSSVDLLGQKPVLTSFCWVVAGLTKLQYDAAVVEVSNIVPGFFFSCYWTDTALLLLLRRVELGENRTLQALHELV